MNTKIENYVIIVSLKSETMDKLINRIPGSHLLISSLPGSALRTHVESLGKPRDVNKRSQSPAWQTTHLLLNNYLVLTKSYLQLQVKVG